MLKFTQFDCTNFLHLFSILNTLQFFLHNNQLSDYYYC